MNAVKDFFIGRPLSVTIVSVFVLCITAWNGMRAFVAIMDWDVLYRFNGNPAYIAASGLAWFLGGLALFVILLRYKQLALQAGLILSILYILWYWVDRLVIQISPAPNLVFGAIVSTILFIIFNAVLFWPSSRVFFMRRQDE
jgi:hypothetical protein